MVVLRSYAPGNIVSYLASVAAGAIPDPLRTVAVWDKGGHVCNVRAYGAACDGTTDDAPVLTALVAAIGAARATILIPRGVCFIGADLTIPPNVTLQFAGGMLRPASGVTVTVNGSIEAGTKQLFDVSLSGTVVLGFGVTADIWVEWFGAKGNATGQTSVGIDSTVAIQAAIDAGPAYGGVNVRFAGGKYRITAPLLIVNSATHNYRSGLRFLGDGVNSDNQRSTWLVWDSADATSPMVKCYTRDVQFDGFLFTVAQSGGVAAGQSLLAAVDIDQWNGATSLPAEANPSGGTSYVTTHLTFRHCQFTTRAGATTGAGTMKYGVRIGLNAATNCDYHAFWECDWKGMADTGCYIPSTTGQVKNVTFWSCHWTSMQYGIRTTSGSVKLYNPRFTSINTIGGSICVFLGAITDAIAIEDVDLENCMQLLRIDAASGSWPVMIRGGRFATNGIAQLPATPYEFISSTTPGPVTIQGCMFGNNSYNAGDTYFRIKVAGSSTVEGHLIAIGNHFPNATPFATSLNATQSLRLTTLGNRAMTGANAWMSLPDQLRTINGANATASTPLQLGGVAWPLTTVTAHYTLTGNDATVVSTAAGLTLTLPSAVTSGAGRCFTLKNAATGTSTTVASTAGTIDGAATQTIPAAFGSLTVQSDGTTWLIISRV